MSILSDAWTGKTTWQTAVTRIEADVTKAFSGSTVATQAEAAILTDLKQAASNAIGAADTLLGGLIGPATLTVETTVNGLLASAVGPVAGVVTPAIDAAIVTAANALKAAVDAQVVAFRASLTK
jgi:hypothetical protein